MDGVLVNKNTNNNMRGNKHDIRFSLMISV